MGTSSLILHTAFLFWPVAFTHERDGWLCGTYARLEGLGHQEVLEKGRVRRRFQAQGLKGERLGDIRITEPEVNSSFLWHENLTAAVEAQKVLYETDILDFERYCEPRALVYGERAREALLRFINMESGDIEKAIGFVQEFGAFETPGPSLENAMSSNRPPKVQQFWNDCLVGVDRTDPFAICLDKFWDVQKDILELWSLADSLSERKKDAVSEVCKHRRPDFQFRGQPDWLAIGKAVLAAELSPSLNDSSPNPPRLLLHDREGRFIALTLCRSVRSALYVQLLTEIVSKSQHRRCLHCREYFVPKVKSQRYCKAPCQNVAKVRRSREKKSREQKQGLVQKSNRKTDA